ncbi:hypothetical protein [Phenylobacterium sp. J367]|uniref:hypothetical protein n=1 Tax=Phenylobacterium sp. J367 TaxID=2898435 RepID=UPI00215191DD|nr:hypothetical protein [Phenylobacterium sp. J367]MCR5880932.1 hypothetical protein [Phenylobacterium sp. J367]
MRVDATPLPASASDVGVAESFESFDWERTPLGPRADWPGALAGLVALVRRLRHPAFLLWGPEQTFIYNEAYLPILGERGARRLGSPVLRGVARGGR